MSFEQLAGPETKDFPPGHLVALREAILNEILRGTTRPGRHAPRSRKRFLIVVLAVGACASAAPAFGVQTAVLQAIGVGENNHAMLAPDDAVRAVNTEWRDRLEAGATAEPQRIFRNPSVAALREAIAAASTRYGFALERLDVLRPLQDAPMLIVKVKDVEQFAHDAPAVLAMLDPKTSGSDSEGWAYEGFLLEARDAENVPFLAVYNHWRGPSGGGGQWARSPELLPYDHGTHPRFVPPDQR